MKILGSYPKTRLRRLRKHNWLRNLVTENNISQNDLILPIFVREGKNKIESIKTMPDVKRYSVDKLPSILKKLCFEKESGRLLIEPKTIRVSAEPLNTSLRSRCEKIFPDSTVENTYAGSEGFSAFNCSKNKNKLHLSEDFSLFEIYKDKGLVFTKPLSL